MLCSACSTEGFSNLPKPKGAKPAVKKRVVVKKVEEEKSRAIPTLQSICVAVSSFTPVIILCMIADMSHRGQLIGQNIESIDALGEIGPQNLDKICKIVCKLRSLTPTNLKLFLDIGHSDLKLYDCTSCVLPSSLVISHLSDWSSLPLPRSAPSDITADDLISLCKFSPHLERLTLRMCGRLDNTVMAEWGKGFKQLKYLSLYGEFLPPLVCHSYSRTQS